MNGTLHNMTQLVGIGWPIEAPKILAQDTPVAVPAGYLPQWDSQLIINIISAVAILVIGWIVAAIAAAAIKNLLKRTDIDNRIASWVSGSPSRGSELPVEKWISTAVFWIIMIFVLVIFFDKLNLPAVSQPLNTFLEQITGFIPSLFSALILLALAWAIATVVKLVVSRSLRALGIDERLNQQVSDTPGESQISLSETLANVLYWFIFLLFLPLILDALGLREALAPVSNLVNQILAALPKILKAVIIGAAGWLLAQVVRRIVTNLLAATGTDQLGARFGLTRTAGGQSLSWIIGTIVYVLVLIPTTIAALNALEIDAISVPAVAMLNEILLAIPDIFTAAIILVLFYVIGRFVADLVTSILTSVGFNNVFSWMGIQSPTTLPTVPPPPPADNPYATESPTVVQQPSTRTPSEIVGIVVLVGIMLFAAVTASDVLGLTALTGIIFQIIEIAGRVLIGIIVFAIGLYLANLTFNLIVSSGSAQSRFLAQAARIAILAFVGAMALQQMGLAPNIVNLAFGLLFGAIAIAVALAFGLGGRDIANEQIREWLNDFKRK
jgi:hypothetical protein